MKIIKNNLKLIIGIIIGAVISGTSVYAISMVARDVSYDNTTSGSPATNMQGAIDDLYEKASDGGEIVTVSLGTGTSYNIKELYPDLWDKLTVSNFYYKVSSKDYKASSYDSRPSVSGNPGTHFVAPSLSYNTETGVLTVNRGTAQTYWYNSTGGYGSMGSSVASTVTAYMIYVD